MCCATTVTAPCSPYLIPGYALLLLFLHQLWCSLAPTWAPSVSQNQSTVLWRFRELNWLPRGPGEPGKVQGRGVAGWEGEGRGRARGNTSPGAAASCQGSLAAGSLGLSPQKTQRPLPKVRESVCLVVALRSTPAPVDGEGHKSPEGFFFIPLFPLTLI